MRWCVVPQRPIEQITDECERIALACDTLMEEAARADVSIDGLHLEVLRAGAEIARLDEAQSRLDGQRKALSARLFWFRLRPSELLATAGRAAGTLWHRGKSQSAPYRTLRGFR